MTNSWRMQDKADLDQPIDEIFLLGIVTHVLEGQHHHRGFFGQWQQCVRDQRRSRRLHGSSCRGRCGGEVGCIPHRAEGTYRAIDVLKGKFAQVGKCRLEAPGHNIMDSPGYGDATFGRFRLQPGRDVHTIAVKIAVVDDDISQMQANAEDNATIFGLVTVGLKNGLLELDGGLEGVNGARELGQGPSPVSLTKRPP